MASVDAVPTSSVQTFATLNPPAENHCAFAPTAALGVLLYLGEV